MSWTITANGKWYLKGIGKVYNCDCTAPIEQNTYYHLSCASRKNTTLKVKRPYTDRVLGRKAPKELES